MLALLKSLFKELPEPDPCLQQGRYTLFISYLINNCWRPLSAERGPERGWLWQNWKPKYVQALNVKRQLTSPGRDCCFSLLVPKRDIVCVDMHSSVWLFATPWTVVRQAPLSVGFTRQDNWSGLSSSRGSSQSRDWTNVSCIGRWFFFVFVFVFFFYHWATWEAQ